MFQQSFTKNTALPYYTYDQRGLLRNWSPQDGAQALVDGLGMFVYSDSNSQILDGNNVNTYQAMDDDESCFLTGNGAWLLEYPHWDLINNWMLPDIEALYAATFFNGIPRLPGQILYGSANNKITSITATSSATNGVTFTIPVIGASIGDRVFITPNQEPLAAAMTYSLYIQYAYVSSAGTVTVRINAPSVGTNTLSAGLVWYATVIKSS